MSERRKFLFLYLTTGAGHISTAKVLRHEILKLYPEAEIVMVHGFDKHNYVGKSLFEHGYFLATNIFHGAFSLVYDISRFRPVMTAFSKAIHGHTTRYFEKIIEQENPTDIVSFHFALTPHMKSAIIRSHRKIRLTTMVTDPFTLPAAWFYERDQKYLVYSEEARQYGISLKVPPENITVVPFIMNKKYAMPFNDGDIAVLRRKHGFDQNKKVLLMVGGGDGIPGAIEIINKCVLRKAGFAIAIVCGKDVAKKTYFEGLKRIYPRLDLHVFGFVNFLDELVKLSDCVVMKAGPATLIEVLSCRKPVIICRYIHNQELGNMRFAVNNHVGWFIQKPGPIYDKVEELLNDEHFSEKMAANFERLKIDTDASKIAKLLLAE